MQNSSFFDFQKWNNYLKSNFSGSLAITSHGKNSEDVCVMQPMEHSFQLSERDFIENHSFTRGNYSKNGQKGYWEEFRLRIKKPKHFSEKELIPSGKYRVKVQIEGIEKPIVKTFVRKNFLGFPYWSKGKLPDSIHLDNMLRDNVEYFFS